MKEHNDKGLKAARIIMEIADIHSFTNDVVAITWSEEDV